MSREIEDEELMDLIFRILEEESKREYMTLQVKADLGKKMFNTFRKLDLLQELLEDDSITEIMINGTQNIFVEKGGHLQMTDK